MINGWSSPPPVGDRSSFGCTDDARYSYFGEALLVDALAEADSLTEAFEQAREIVSAREAEQDYTPSEPQMAGGEGLGRYLRRSATELQLLP